jgi:cysteinyl-tRNA synthetase
LTEERPPEPIRALARERAAARAARDWPTADRLRGEIEAAGWTVVDAGTAYRLQAAHPPDVERGGRTRYGRSEAVPSRLAEPPVGVASVVIVATGPPADVIRAVAAVRGHGGEDLQVIVVADGPSDAMDTALDELQATPGIEVIRTSGPLGHAAALNIGIRRAAAPVVVVLDPSVEPTADVVTPLVRALDDETVAVAGPYGILSRDLRHFEDAPAGDVDAIEGYCLAFRRADAAERGPLDEGFRFYRNLDIWWSLVLRDEGEGRGPRRAVAVGGLPLIRHEHRGWASVPESERDRLSKRNYYRILKRFGNRLDLLVRPDGGPSSA